MKTSRPMTADPRQSAVSQTHNIINKRYCACTLLWPKLKGVISNQIKSLLLSHHHSTSALVSEILESVLQTVQKQKQFTYRQYIFTDCTEDNVQNTRTHTQYTQCTIKTVLVTKAVLGACSSLNFYKEYLFGFDHII